jgi:hypothetical protein
MKKAQMMTSELRQRESPAKYTALRQWLTHIAETPQKLLTINPTAIS